MKDQVDFSELGRVIEQLGRDRGIKKEIIVGAIEQAFEVTARKKYGIQGEFDAKYSAEDGEIEIFQYKTVVNEVKDAITEMTLKDARALDSQADIGDQLGIKILNPSFSRVDIQTAKQIIFQKVRDVEREILFSEFKHREGEMVTGIVRRFERGNVIVDLGKADALIPRREVIFGESFKPGDRVQAYLSQVVMSNRGPEILLSRTSPKFMIRLFEMEVPEVQDGTIEVKAAAREPGQRAKIAVYTGDRDIDPVGACVGMKGARVQNIVSELQGEKIDVVRWSPDTETFIKSALAPSEISSVHINNDDRVIDVIVEDDQLSLAIGRRGQNVRLAAMLTGYKINIVSKSRLQDKVKLAVENLLQLDAVSESMAQMLVQVGVMSIIDLSASDEADLQKNLRVTLEESQRLINAAKTAVESGEIKVDLATTDEIISASAAPGKGGYISDQPQRSDDKQKFSDAERRLREELAAFRLK